MKSSVEQILSSRHWYWVAALGLLSYFFTVCQLADNTPKFDDINDVFGFFKQYALAQTPLQKFGAFFYPNNEHVTAVDHLIYFVQYQLLGEVRFYPLIIIGHLIIIATGMLLGLSLESPRKAFYFTVFILAYVNFYSWDSSFKAMTAISNQAVILFSLASIKMLFQHHKIATAMMFALLASFSQGNGFLVWPLGLLILMFDPHWINKRRWPMLQWLFCTLMAAALYTWARHHYGEPSSQTVTLALQKLHQHPFTPLLSIFIFLGNGVLDATHAWLAVCTGIGCLSVLGWITLRHRQNCGLILLFASFLIASAILAAGLRGLFSENAESIIQSRYKMYSLAFIAITIIVLIEQARSSAQRIPLAVAALILALFANLSSYRFIPDIQHQAQLFRDSYRQWLIDGDFRHQATYFPPMSDHFLFVAHYLDVFDFLTLEEAPHVIELGRNPAEPLCTMASHAAPFPLSATHRGNAITVSIDTVLPTAAQKVVIAVCRENLLIGIVTLARAASGQHHWVIAEEQIPPGEYRLLLQTDESPPYETPLNKKPRKVATEMQQLFSTTATRHR